MNHLDQRIGIWSGVVFVSLLGAALLLAGFIPPPSPVLSPEEVAAFYAERGMRVPLAMIVAMIGIAFIPPFVAAISTQMRRIQGISRMAADMQLGVGNAAILALLVPVMLFGVAAFRPAHNLDVTYALHDMAWLFFIAPFSLAVAQNGAIALGVLLDRSSTPVFPRWLGYFNIWTALLFVPGGFALVFKSGPFAWNGILAFWIAASAFFAWFIVMVVMLFRALATDTGGD